MNLDRIVKHLKSQGTRLMFVVGEHDPPKYIKQTLDMQTVRTKKFTMNMLTTKVLLLCVMCMVRLKTFLK